MSLAVTFSNVSWATSDGRVLISDLNLAFGIGRTGLVGRNGTGKTTLLRMISGELCPRSGKVVVNGRIGLLRQTVQMRPDETVVEAFGVSAELARLRRAEEGRATLEELAEIDWSLEHRIQTALARVGLPVGVNARLDQLSGGQRTRVQLAAAYFAEPDFLLLDEPTNNLDRDGREAVIGFLEEWRRGAIVVSHDRELLETMDAIVELTSLGVTTYGGNWRVYRERKDSELAAARRELVQAEKRVATVARSAQVTAERKSRRDAAGRRKMAADDTPRINLGRLKDRAEASGGGLVRMAERRREEACDAAAEARQKIEILQPFAVTVPSTGLPEGKTVLELKDIRAGYHPGEPVIDGLSLSITGPERIAVTGPNGSGKTTLLALITGTMKPWSGILRLGAECSILDQAVSILEPSKSIRDNFRRMHPQLEEQGCRAALARFMFRADAALQIVETLSGGQLLRAGLACVLGGDRPPAFLVLDEPTNHLDLDSIQAVEAGLRAYDGALLVVSHDESFLREIGITRRLELPL